MAKTQIRNPLSGEVEHEAGGSGASLNGAVAPAGSAERVRDLDGEEDGSGQALPLADGEEEREAPGITVNTYDAKGEAVDRPVAPSTPPMPGFAAPTLDLWSPYHGRRVASMALTFSGTCDLIGTRADVREAAPRIDLGRRLSMQIAGTVKGVKHKSDDAWGPVDGVVTLAVDEVRFDDDEEDDEAQEMSERIQAALTACGEMLEQFAPGEDGEDGYEDVRSALGDLMDILNDVSRCELCGADITADAAMCRACAETVPSSLRGADPETAAEVEEPAAESSAVEEADAP